MTRSDEYFNKYNGKAIDVDKAYSVQCVDAFIQYCRDYDIPYMNTVTGWADGLFTHRKDHYKKYFDVITNFNELKDGDWIFTKNPSHVAMWYKGKMFSQNQAGKNDGFSLKPFTGTFIGAYRDKANTDKDTFLVKVNCEVLRVRKEPSINSRIVTRVKKGEVYTILETIEKDGYTWGKLKSGAGWIALNYTNRI